MIHSTLPPPFQYFWRCAHHPSATLNFFERRRVCGSGCHDSELKWHHGGVHPAPRKNIGV